MIRVWFREGGLREMSGMVARVCFCQDQAKHMPSSNKIKTRKERDVVIWFKQDQIRPSQKEGERDER